MNNNELGYRVYDHNDERIFPRPGFGFGAPFLTGLAAGALLPPPYGYPYPPYPPPYPPYPPYPYPPYPYYK
ncbi:hypothetical protein [Aquibacillus halophilus]|uniref:hypothetical protein n=1 Tax=Aquibacillus halophilus TaxID=930132 RepID=UPI001F10BE54|nr:hypothetical protein [Aquibacillus halophilus]